MARLKIYDLKNVNRIGIISSPCDVAVACLDIKGYMATETMLLSEFVVWFINLQLVKNTKVFVLKGDPLFKHIEKMSEIKEANAYDIDCQSNYSKTEFSNLTNYNAKNKNERMAGILAITIA